MLFKSKLRNTIKLIDKELNETIEEFDFQNSNQEKEVHKEWVCNNFRHVMEGAGDIFRELSKETNSFGYIMEKIKRIEKFILRDRIGEHSWDESFDYAKTNDSEHIKNIIGLWEKQPFSTEEQEIAIRLNLSLLKGDFDKATEIIGVLKGLKQVGYYSLKLNEDITGSMREFKRLKTILQMREYARENFEFIDDGSSREAYELPDGNVLKLAKTDAGRSQNGLEYRVGAKNDNPILAKIYEADFSSKQHFSWVVMERCYEIDESDFFKMYKVNLFNLSTMARRISSGLKFVSSTATKEFIKNFKDLILKHKYLSPGDFEGIHQWGKTKDGRIVLVDYGLSNKIYSKHYTLNEGNPNDGFRVKPQQVIPERSKQESLNLFQEFKGIKSPFTMYNFAEENFKYISEGSSRKIHKIANDRVLKLAISEAGNSQNGLEYRIGGKNNSPILANIYDVDMNSAEHFSWIVMEYCSPITKDIFARKTGMKIEKMESVCEHIILNRGKVYDITKKYPRYNAEFLVSLKNLLTKHPYLETGDFEEIHQWGYSKRRNKIVLIDFGLSREIYNTYYRDKSIEDNDGEDED
jgi:hypothetical protein